MASSQGLGLSHARIQNTVTSKDPYTSLSSLFHRCQHHLNLSPTTALTSLRHERIQLETLLSDVWTREILPYPGLSARVHGENLHASAHHIMRKLSAASIATFSKRFSGATRAREAPEENVYDGLDNRTSPTIGHLESPHDIRTGLQRVQVLDSPAATTHDEKLHSTTQINHSLDITSAISKETAGKKSFSMDQKNWGRCSHRTDTSPLGTSSANSTNGKSGTPLLACSDNSGEDKENSMQSGVEEPQGDSDCTGKVEEKSAKRDGSYRNAVVTSIRSIFR